jgi:hypothetical protein
MLPIDSVEPSYILGCAMSAWANPPRWNTEEEREAAAKQWQEFVEVVCKYHSLAIVHVGVLEEIHEDHRR